MAARFNDHRRIERLTQTSLMEPAGVMADGESDAAKILFSAMETVENILKERAQLDREGRTDDPLVVVIGENHNFPGHHLHNLLVLKALNDSDEKTVVGMEQRRSNLLNWLKFAKGYDENDDVLRSTLDEVDVNGKMSMLYLFSNVNLPNAPYTQSILQRSILDMDIPVRFTDAAFAYQAKEEGVHSEHNVLDANDPDTAQSIADCWVQRDKEFDPFEADGVWIRNHHAAGQIEEFAAEQGARIVVQMSGNAHVLGKNDGLDPIYLSGRDSLAQCVKDMGLPVMAVPLHSQLFHQLHLPDDHKLDRHREINPVLDLPRFNYKKGFTSFDDIFQSREQERVDEDLAALGMGSAILNKDDPRWKDGVAEFKQLLRDFDRQYKSNLADHTTKFWVGVGDIDDDQPDDFDGQDLG